MNVLESECGYDASDIRLDCQLSENDLRLFRTVYVVAKHKGTSDFVSVVLETQRVNGLDSFGSLVILNVVCRYLLEKVLRPFPQCSLI